MSDGASKSTPISPPLVPPEPENTQDPATTERQLEPQTQHGSRPTCDSDQGFSSRRVPASYALGSSEADPSLRGASTSEHTISHLSGNPQLQEPPQLDGRAVFDQPVKFDSGVSSREAVVSRDAVHPSRPDAQGDEAQHLARSDLLRRSYRNKSIRSPRAGFVADSDGPVLGTQGSMGGSASFNNGPGTSGTASSPHSKASRSLQPKPPYKTHSSRAVNGTAARTPRRGRQSTFPGAVFIHAGAGFHSHQNERVHLEACNDAATMGMKFLRSGASATEAVEAALRVLEDKEITNAGYGSNLSMDGTVECDATIVDHLGRSGACGAVPNVRNPICLAKLILDKGNQPLTLRRVPPNVLVGEGAKAFAQENGMPIVSNDSLISKNARDRYIRWQEDLRRAEERLQQEDCRRVRRDQDIPCPNQAACQQYDTVSISSGEQSRIGSAQQRDHANAILTGTWNEGQPDSPYRGSPSLETAQGQFIPSPNSTASRTSPTYLWERNPFSFVGHSNAGRGQPSPPKRSRLGRNEAVPGIPGSPSPAEGEEAHDLSQTSRRYGTQDGTLPLQDESNDPRGIKRPFGCAGEEEEWPSLDMITDTIGAIAVDDRGNMAAGSSSGGIGMKHRGRLGPAALVGIGTAVVPADPADQENVCVATVTSGTGEHMATTMASQRCAERIRGNTRRGSHGHDVQEDDEDLIMESFINRDFMGHPGVKNCSSVGAIGVMTVKKTNSGYYLYFAHNTDSFALASMGGSDREPRCVMSRLGNNSQVTRGARKIRLD